MTNKANRRTFPKLIETLGQASGLAYRLLYLLPQKQRTNDQRPTTNFHTDVFTTHIHPFLQIAKKHSTVILPSYSVAVRTETSQSRHVKSVYDKSPTQSWIDMFHEVFQGPKLKPLRNLGIQEITSHYVGLVQLKNYSTYKNLLREIKIILKYNPKSVLHPKFYFYTLLTLFTPRLILRSLTDTYKRIILAHIIGLKSK